MLQLANKNHHPTVQWTDEKTVDNVFNYRLLKQELLTI